MDDIKEAAYVEAIMERNETIMRLEAELAYCRVEKTRREPQDSQKLITFLTGMVAGGVLVTFLSHTLAAVGG